MAGPKKFKVPYKMPSGYYSSVTIQGNTVYKRPRDSRWIAPELEHARRVMALPAAAVYFCAATDACGDVLIMPNAGQPIRHRAPKDAHSTIRHLLEGLATLHAAGIIHGDVTDSNILIDDLDVPRFIDFYRPAKGRISKNSAPEEHIHGPHTSMAIDCCRLGYVLQKSYGDCHPVIAALLEPDPTKRPSACEALEYLKSS